MSSSSSSSSSTRPRVPKAGPEPLLLSRKEVDVLYEVFDVVRRALELLGVKYIVTGGSLLGAIRQHSILFCDDDIDIAVIDDHSFDCSEIQEGEATGSSSSSSSSSSSVYESIVVPGLQSALDAVVADEANDCTNQCVYQIKPWEGGDRIRSKRYNSVFLDLFVLRTYPTLQSFVSVIGVKRNGRPQPESYVNSLLDTIQNCTTTNSHGRQNKHSNYESMFPFWHFATRKAIEMWPKEVYRVAASIPHYSNNDAAAAVAAASTIDAAADELFPLRNDLKFGPLTGVFGPNMPVTLLKRAFGDDCFEVYYRSVSHHQASQASVPPPPPPPPLPLQQPAHQPTGDTENSNENNANGKVSLPPLVAPGGTWEDSPKVPLEDEHYLPLQPLARKRRRPTLHCKDSVFEYLETQSAREAIEQEALLWGRRPGESNADADADADADGNTNTNTNTNTSADTHQQRPNKTIYMDGVFDLFHIGHLEAIRQCAALGNRVILGVTGDDDATGYKRKPVVPQNERVAIVSALGEVDAVVCPCPLVVTEDFLEAQGIDLVVHGFASDADAERQHEFFAIPMALGKFQRIGYYKGLSTTDRIRTIREREGEREGEREREREREESDPNCADDKPGESDRDQEVSDEKKQEESAPVALPSSAAEESETDGAGAETAVAKSASESRPQWFGAAVAAATNNAPCIPTDPFPLSLRTAIESHIDKARRRRREALAAIRAATGEGVYDSVMSTFLRQQQRHLRTTRALDDPSHYATDLVASLLVSAGLPPGTDLSRLHEAPLVDGRSAKDRLLHALTQNPSPFQKAYDAYVRNVCVPRMVGAVALETTGNDKRCDEIYYQVFPCLRIIQPDEFSIGPHADVAYGHHPCSVNCYVALTDPGGIDDTGNAIGGSAPSSSSLSLSPSPSPSLSLSLFLESRPGAEDWHALFSSEEGAEGPAAYTPRLELFAGAVNLHWTTENKTAKTRVSLDFRLVDGRVFHALECGGHLEGGQRDVYRATPGYYHRCIRSQESHGDKPTWIRDENCRSGTGKNGELAPPDFRIGFPWTVKNWEKFWKKNTKSG